MGPCRCQGTTQQAATSSVHTQRRCPPHPAWQEALARSTATLKALGLHRTAIHSQCGSLILCLGNKRALQESFYCMFVT